MTDFRKLSDLSLVQRYANAHERCIECQATECCAECAATGGPGTHLRSYIEEPPAPELPDELIDEELTDA